MPESKNAAVICELEALDSDLVSRQIDADEIIQRWLIELGYEEVVKAWKRALSGE